MSMTSGKPLRLSRLFSHTDSRAVVLALDHGLQLGPIPGTVDLRAVVSLAVEAGLDGIILGPGALARSQDLLAGRNRPAIIMRLDQTTMWRLGGRFSQDQGQTRMIAGVEDALQLGADAILTYLFTCHRDPALETRSVEMVGQIANAARTWGMPLVVEPMAAREGRLATPFDGETIAMNTRIAVEMGADAIKADWTANAADFRQVVRGAVDVPVLVAGGARMESDLDTLALVRDLLSAGARGVMFGRSLFQSPQPLTLMKLVRAMVHDKLDYEGAAAQLSPDTPATAERKATGVQSATSA